MSDGEQIPMAEGDDVRIHESVVVSIVRNVVGKVEGVSRISGNSLMDNIAGIMGSRRLQDRAISVKMGDSSVSVELSVNLIFGYKLPEVALALQTAVRKEIESITGLRAEKVDVIVCEFEEPAESSEPERKE